MTDSAGPKIAYIMSRFPKLTETFVLYEMIRMEQEGFSIEVYPLLRERRPVNHPEAQRLVQRAHYLHFFSLSILKANLYFMRRSWKSYFRLWMEVLSETWGSLNFFCGAIAILPKSVCFAYLMQEEGIDHIHCHFVNHPTMAAFIIHRLTGIPYSFTAHGSDLHVDRRMLARKTEASAFGITVSRYNKELMVRECGEKSRQKIHVIHCGVDTELFHPRLTNGGGDAQAPLQVLCVGSLEEVKGHRYLLEACSELVRGGVDFRCHVVGEGPLRAKIERLIVRWELRDCVHLLGARSRQEVLNMLGKADVVVLASVPTREGKREGIPVALMEAMACSLPVVASNISGIPELIESGRNGFLVRPRDSRGLARALRRLKQDPGLRRRIGQSSRRTVIRDFNLEINASRLSRLFRTQCRATGASEE